MRHSVATAFSRRFKDRETLLILKILQYRADWLISHDLDHEMAEVSGSAPSMTTSASI